MLRSFVSSNFYFEPYSLLHFVAQTGDNYEMHARGLSSFCTDVFIHECQEFLVCLLSQNIYLAKKSSTTVQIFWHHFLHESMFVERRLKFIAESIFRLLFFFINLFEVPSFDDEILVNIYIIMPPETLEILTNSWVWGKKNCTSKNWRRTIEIGTRQSSILIPSNSVLNTQLSLQDKFMQRLFIFISSFSEVRVQSNGQVPLTGSIGVSRGMLSAFVASEKHHTQFSTYTCT